MRHTALPCIINGRLAGQKGLKTATDRDRVKSRARLEQGASETDPIVFHIPRLASTHESAILKG